LSGLFRDDFAKIKPSSNLLNMTDEKLLNFCERYGRRARIWRQKFTGLLPEVNRRRLYERRGCQSIFEFAYKLAGLSKEQVQRALQLGRQFQNMPALHEVLVEGQASVSKLAKVASIATLENEEFLAEQVRLLPRRALETLVRDEQVLEKQNASPKPLFDTKVVPGNNFAFSAEVLEELSRLHSQGHDVNAILLDLLQERRQKIIKNKQELGETAQPTTSRYIPAQARHLLQEEYGQNCSISTCKKPAKEIHHTQRFALASSHDPRYLAPLCHEHHLLAHSVDVKFHQVRSG
jgi:hypothetical protein